MTLSTSAQTPNVPEVTVDAGDYDNPNSTATVMIEGTAIVCYKSDDSIVVDVLTPENQDMPMLAVCVNDHYVFDNRPDWGAS